MAHGDGISEEDKKRVREWAKEMAAKAPPLSPEAAREITGIVHRAARRDTERRYAAVRKIVKGAPVTDEERVLATDDAMITALYVRFERAERTLQNLRHQLLVIDRQLHDEGTEALQAEMAAADDDVARKVAETARLIYGDAARMVHDLWASSFDPLTEREAG